jgi:hypothetical protein
VLAVRRGAVDARDFLVDLFGCGEYPRNCFGVLAVPSTSQKLAEVVRTRTGIYLSVVCPGAGDLLWTNNLSDLANAAAARVNLAINQSGAFGVAWNLQINATVSSNALTVSLKGNDGKRAECIESNRHPISQRYRREWRSVVAAAYWSDHLAIRWASPTTCQGAFVAVRWIAK